MQTLRQVQGCGCRHISIWVEQVVFSSLLDQEQGALVLLTGHKRGDRETTTGFATVYHLRCTGKLEPKGRDSWRPCKLLEPAIHAHVNTC